MNAERFNPDRLVEQACELAGSDDFGDFGDGGWRDGLARVADGLAHQARLSPLGVEIAVRRHPARPDQSPADRRHRARRTRSGERARSAARSSSWANRAPARPSSYDLLAQDPALRPPLTWEVDYPCPAAATRDLRRRPADRADAGHLGDVRADHPGVPDVPPDGRARRAGVRADLRRRVPQHDLPDAVPAAGLLPLAAVRRRPSPRRTATTESSCSTCSPGCPGSGCSSRPRICGSWTPWSTEYPDALIVQTHRDPLNVISSITALTGVTCAGWPPTRPTWPSARRSPTRRSSSGWTDRWRCATSCPRARSSMCCSPTSCATRGRPSQ